METENVATDIFAAPKRPHPIDVALAALSELAAEILAGNKPSRFVELQSVTSVAMQVQHLRPMVGVDDFHAQGVAMGGPVQMGGMVLPRMGGFGGGDLGDINREMIMLIQGFLEAETSKRKDASRSREAGELATLTELRLQLKDAGDSVPDEITRRIEHLLKRIGEPHVEPDPALHPVALRRREADSAERPDGDRVGEAVAQ